MTSAASGGHRRVPIPKAIAIQPLLNATDLIPNSESLV